MLFLMAEYQLFGASPFLFHLFNVLLHFMCSVLAYLLLSQIFKDKRTPIFAALIFAAHPVHTEAVSWISCIGEPLSAFFSLLSAWLILKKPSRPILSCFSFLFALLAKETAIALPVFLASYLLFFEDTSPLQGRIRPAIRRIIPFIAVAVIFLLIRMAAIGGIGPSGEHNMFYGIHPYMRLLVMLKAFTHYIRLAFFPFDLSVDYFFRPPDSPLRMEFLFPLLTLAVLAVFEYKKKLPKPVLLSALWFFIWLLPVSNLVPTGLIMSERAMYVPSLAVCILFGAALAKFMDFVPLHHKGYARLLSYVLLTAILIPFMILTAHRNQSWDTAVFFQEEEKFLSNRININPRISRNYGMLADVYMQRGDFGEKPEGLLKEAIRLNPADHFSHRAFYRLYDKRNLPEQALEEARAAIMLHPDGESYNIASVQLYKLGRYDEADRMMDEALRLDPHVSVFYQNKGMARMALGDWDGALGFFAKAESLDPGNADVCLNQGIILGSKNEFRASLVKLKKAVELTPGNPETHYYLAVAYIGLGKPSEARMELETALKLKPDYQEASSLLGQM
jgi:tetratricopeptide (TPR) repeat protein